MTRVSWYKKGLVVGIIVLFIWIGIQPSIGFSNNDDTTPPETTHTLNPPEPDGNNSWYVSDVNVTLNATDDLSGVKEIRYRIDGGVVHVISGDNGSFILNEDGEYIFVEYWAIDNAGNDEDSHIFTIDMDQTKPDIDLVYEVTGGNWLTGWEITFTATATDDMSGICYIEFYLNNELQETVTDPGPTYSWSWKYFPIKNITFKVIAYDCAGNYAEAVINGSDIKVCSRSNFLNQYSHNVWYHWFLERFPLLNLLLQRLLY